MEYSDFRKRLDEIRTDIPPRQQPNLMAKLSYKCAHNITLLSDPLAVDERLEGFEYAFKGLVDEDQWSEIRKWLSDGPDRQKSFIKRFMEADCIDLHDEQKTDDTIVIYFEDGYPAHFGRIDGHNFCSKWGTNGHIWRHKLWEIPASYGKEVKYSNGRIERRTFHDFLSGFGG